MRLPDVIFIQSLIPKSGLWPELLSSLLGAIVGGLLVFGTQLYFELRRRRIEYSERDFELYLHISDGLNDVLGLALSYFQMLGLEQWPLKPLSGVRPILCNATLNSNAPANLLATFVGDDAKDLTHCYFELQNLRAIILGANTAFLEAHTATISMSAQLGQLGPDMSMTNTFDAAVAEHRPLIIESQKTELLLKQLLHSLLIYSDKAMAFQTRYNNYKSKHKRKGPRSLKIEFSERAGSELSIRELLFVSNEQTSPSN